MEFKYQMKDLTSVVKKTPQAIHDLIKKNKDLSMLVNSNSIKSGRLRFYNQAVLDWLINYYKPEIPTDAALGADIVEPDAAAIPEPTPPGTNNTEDAATPPPDVAAQLDALRQEVKRLTEENERLRAAYDKAEAERGELMKQNGVLALTLQQVQQEKMLYLPAPKKPFGERVRDFINQISKK